MFPFFNKHFNNPMLNGQKILEIKAPNGGFYRFSTNVIDDKTFDVLRNKLEEAVKNNDQKAFDLAWNELTSNNKFISNFENELDKFHSSFQQLFQETNRFFNNRNSFLLDHPFFTEPKALTEQSIDQQIEHYQQKIDKLQNEKNNINLKNRKQQLQEDLANKKNRLDAKLEEFAKNLDNDQMKKKLTKEMTALNDEIKQLEKELKNL
ncbi:hypothetical protein [Ureibacillus acetophenoni]|uniref:Uncharacterized protein n=1 Tax=Ureibacillus acetophenoni TaxID=614649 RepID=A0A285UFC6_9BACL|nr:hypothetical protein [Ureibacillus acetophenoni]SOC40625.1 hypothetical protein SAMN05877842_10892 [Ureibacillus acetophenoni]